MRKLNTILIPNDYIKEKYLKNMVPLAIGGLSKELLNEEIAKGIKSVRLGLLYSAEDIDLEFERMYRCEKLGYC